MSNEGNANILVVDDNPLIVNVLTTLLKSQNYHVYSSSNGKDAIDNLQKKTIDVIICDVMMPEMDGYAFHEYVRSKSEFAHIPFVFLTALGSNDELCHGRESGADDYLVKPFNPTELLSVIKGKVIRSKKQKTQNSARYDSFRKRVLQTLSHEIRTPLVAINTGTELLLNNKAATPSLPERTTKLLSAIQKGGERLERLISDFMLIQQIETGTAKQLYADNRHVIDIQTLIDNLTVSVQPELNSANFRLTTEVVHPEIKLLIYEAQIIDALTRLINNGIKFSENSNEIELVSYLKNGDICIDIKDHGIGIDVDHIQEALEIFGQQDREYLEQQGSGLGLAIANKYININHGNLSFSNRPEGGCIASVTLPIEI